MRTMMKPWVVETGKGDDEAGNGDIGMKALIFLTSLDEEIQRSIQEFARSKPVVVGDNKKEENIGR